MKINAFVVLAILVGSTSFSNANAGGWTNNLFVDRIAPRPEKNKIYIMVKSSNYIHTCETDDGRHYLEIPMADDPGKYLFSTLLMLNSTGKDAIFYVHEGCKTKYLETCGKNDCKVF